MFDRIIEQVGVIRHVAHFLVSSLCVFSVGLAIAAEALDVQRVLQRVIANADLEEPLPEPTRHRLRFNGPRLRLPSSLAVSPERAISAMSARSSCGCSGLSGSSHSNFFGRDRLNGGNVKPGARRMPRFPPRAGGQLLSPWRTGTTLRWDGSCHLRGRRYEQTRLALLASIRP